MLHAFLLSCAISVFMVKYLCIFTSTLCFSVLQFYTRSKDRLDGKEALRLKPTVGKDSVEFCRHSLSIG